MQFTNENRTSSSRSFLNAHYQRKPVHCSSRERILPTKTRALFLSGHVLRANGIRDEDMLLFGVCRKMSEIDGIGGGARNIDLICI